jgi:tRNA(fMet)-specific endonuclease VapC
MTHLLDTNACIAAMRGDESVRCRMLSHVPSDLGISTITLFELLAGAERCRDPGSERKKIESLLEPLHLLPFDEEAAKETARLRWHLEGRGCPIGPYDLQLAGQALALNVVLVSRNCGEFRRVPDLRWENWESRQPLVD